MHRVLQRVIMTVALASLLGCFFLFSSCDKGPVNTQKTQEATSSGPAEIVKKGIITEEDYKNLLNTQSNYPNKELGFSGLLEKNGIGEFKEYLNENHGEILFLDEISGYTQFSLSAAAATSLLSDNGYTFERNFIQRILNIKSKSNLILSLQLDKESSNKKNKDELGLAQWKQENLEVDEKTGLSDIHPALLMKTREWANEFQKEYGKELNGENATIAVVDTGLDIARTDAFQDRISYLRSLRQEDVAKLTLATEEVIDGVTYLTAEINNKKVKIEKTATLSANRPYYLGYFTEIQFKGPDGYDNYDLNQDGKTNGIFPIIVFKNDQGQFEAYINAKSSSLYGAQGSDSIEGENRLLDFNWVADNLKGADRFHQDKQNPINSYYKYTTRLDILKNGKLISDRNKGLINVGITLEAGFELTNDGSELKEKSKPTDKQKIYHVGIVGLDNMGHGTHCAGISAGNYQTGNGPEKTPSLGRFSSVANKAKIVGITYLGGESNYTDLNKMIIILAKKFPNLVFNFSWGGNTRLNDSQNPQAKIYDALSMVYDITFVKSAGNEGSGLKSHGVIASKYMLTVSNYYSTNSRKVFGTAQLDDDQYFLETSSSRGPLVDGTLKPDIGAPGWVLSSLPLGKPVGENTKEKSFEYWPGTSMATPNAVSVIALLHDAVEKADIAHADPISHKGALSIDKIHMALKNSALPYSEFHYADCVVKGAESCKMSKKVRKVNWVDGGAGRINGLGAWKVLKDIINKPKTFYNVKAKSFFDGYNEEAQGYFLIDAIHDYLVFSISLAGLHTSTSLSELNRNEELTLRIPADVDWLSFDATKDQKVRELSLFTNEEILVNVYLRKDKLIDPETGRLKAGVHNAVLKGFNHRYPQYHDFEFPVTLVGYDSKFDSMVDKSHLSVQGFIPADQSANYRFPINGDHESFYIDLTATKANPGEVRMMLYYNGVKIPKDLLAPGTISNWVSMRSEFDGEGRERFRYTLNDAPKGMYEIVVVAHSMSPYSYEDIVGSFYNLSIGKLSLETNGPIEMKKTKAAYHLSMKQLKNAGTTMRIDGSYVYARGLRHQRVLDLKDGEMPKYPITVPEGVSKLKITGAYNGDSKFTKIDFVLYNDKDEPMGLSFDPGPTQVLEIKIPKAGTYQLEVIAEGIISKDGENFDLTIDQLFEEPVVLASNLEGPKEEFNLKPNARWLGGKSYNFHKTIPTNLIKVLPQIDNTYEPILGVIIQALIGNNNEKITILKTDI